MEPRWLDADERAAWLRLSAVAELLPAALDTQLRRDSGLTHFEYFVLAMLSEAPGAQPADDGPRPPHQRHPPPALARHRPPRGPRAGGALPLPARTGAPPTPGSRPPAGTSVVDAAPGHVDAVRQHVLDPLSRTQLDQLAAIGEALLTRLDPDDRFGARAAARASDAASDAGSAVTR